MDERRGLPSVGKHIKGFLVDIGETDQGHEVDGLEQAIHRAPFILTSAVIILFMYLVVSFYVSAEYLASFSFMLALTCTFI